MSKFVLTAQLRLQAPRNTQQVVNQIQSQLAGVSVPVNVQGASKAQSQIKGVAQAANQATSAAQNMSKAFGLSLKRFAAFTIASRAVSLLTNSLGGAVNEAIEFQREIVKIAQVTGKSVKQLKGLSDEVTRLSVRLGTSSKELLSVGRILAQAGIQADDLRVALAALAKTTLAPTFENIGKTAEGVVAILAQFGQGVGALERQLGAINAVAGQFAVESGDLIAAVRRFGGVFKSAGGDLNELLALFTSVRATTRESAESIATGLRTIFTRIQRPSTIQFLQEIGVELTNSEGRFVGAYEAVRRLSKAFADMPAGDLRFIQIAEQLGGFRQIGKVIPLLQQFEMAERARQAAIAGGDSLTKDAAKAQQALSVQIIKVKEEFLALVRGVTESSTFQVMAKTALSLASALIKVADALKPILPLMAAFAAVKLTQNIGGMAAGLGAGLKGGKNQGGRIHAFASGGVVPGTGNRDTVPAMLQPGEFVIRKSSVKKMGTGQLHAMNSNKFARGGLVIERTDDSKYAGLFARPRGKDKSGKVISTVLTKGVEGKEVLATTGAPASYFISGVDEDRFVSKSKSVLSRGINEIVKGLAIDEVTANKAHDNIINDIGPDDVAGKIFEGVTRTAIGDFRKGGSKQGFDIPALKDQKKRDTLGTLFGVGGDRFDKMDLDNKLTESGKNRSSLLKKASNAGHLLSPIQLVTFQSNRTLAQMMAFKRGEARNKLLFNRRSDLETAKSKLGSVGLDTDTQKLVARRLNTDIGKINAEGGLSQVWKPNKPKKSAAGGSISGSDTVPALLTPGEFVVNKKSAQNIGYASLNRMNKQGVSGFAAGGPVGVQKFASGGGVGGMDKMTGLLMVMSSLSATTSSVVKAETEMGKTITDISDAMTASGMQFMMFHQMLKMGSRDVSDLGKSADKASKSVDKEAKAEDEKPKPPTAVEDAGKGAIKSPGPPPKKVDPMAALTQLKPEEELKLAPKGTSLKGVKPEEEMRLAPLPEDEKPKAKKPAAAPPSDEPLDPRKDAAKKKAAEDAGKEFGEGRKVVEKERKITAEGEKKDVIAKGKVEGAMRDKNSKLGLKAQEAEQASQAADQDHQGKKNESKASREELKEAQEGEGKIRANKKQKEQDLKTAKGEEASAAGTAKTDKSASQAANKQAKTDQQAFDKNQKAQADAARKEATQRGKAQTADKTKKGHQQEMLTQQETITQAETQSGKVSKEQSGLDKEISAQEQKITKGKADQERRAKGGGDVESMNSAMAKQEKHLAELKAKYEANNKTLDKNKKTIKDATKARDQAIKAGIKAQNQQTKATTAADGHVDSLQELGQAEGKLKTNLDKSSKAATNAGKAAKTSATAHTTATGQRRAAGTALTKTNNALVVASNKVATAQKKVVNARKAVRESLKATGQAAKKAGQALLKFKNHSQKLARVAAKPAAAFRKLGNAVQKAGQAARRAGMSMRKMGGKMAGMGAGMAQAGAGIAIIMQGVMDVLTKGAARAREKAEAAGDVQEVERQMDKERKLKDIGGIAKGAGQGAMVGGMMGMIAGPVGAAVGAAVGGIAGGLGTFFMQMWGKRDADEKHKEEKAAKRVQMSTKEMDRVLKEFAKDQKSGKGQFAGATGRMNMAQQVAAQSRSSEEAIRGIKDPKKRQKETEELAKHTRSAASELGRTSKTQAELEQHIKSLSQQSSVSEDEIRKLAEASFKAAEAMRRVAKANVDLMVVMSTFGAAKVAVDNVLASFETGAVSLDRSIATIEAAQENIGMGREGAQALEVSREAVLGVVGGAGTSVGKAVNRSFDRAQDVNQFMGGIQGKLAGLDLSQAEPGKAKEQLRTSLTAGLAADSDIRQSIEAALADPDFDATGDITEIIKKIKAGLDPLAAAALESAKALAAHQKVIVQLTQQRRAAELKYIETQKQAINQQLEAAKLFEEFGGAKLSTAQKSGARIAQFNLTAKDAGVGGLGTGSARDIGRVSQQIADKFQVQSTQAMSGAGTFAGAEGVDKDRRKELQSANKALIEFTKQRIGMLKEELAIVQKKNAAEKSALDKLISGDIEGFIEGQAAAGAGAALRTGDAGLAGLFGAGALGAGFKTLAGQGLSGGQMTRAAGMTLGAVGIQDPRSAQVLAGTTAEAEAIKAQGRELSQSLGAQAQQMADMESMNVTAAEVKIDAANVAFEQTMQSKVAQQDRAEAMGRARGGLIYASRGVFVPRGTDTVPAMLTPGEFVVNRASVNRGNNLQILRAMNSKGPAGNQPSTGAGMAAGGQVGYYALGDLVKQIGSVFSDAGSSLTNVFASFESAVQTLQGMTFQHNVGPVTATVDFLNLPNLKEDIKREVLDAVAGNLSKKPVLSDSDLPPQE